MFQKLLLTLLLTLTVGIASAGKMVLLEEAVEFETLSLRVSDKGKGDFQIRACDECNDIQLKIAPTTSLKIAGKRLPLSKLNSTTLRDGTVFYRESDSVVTRIEAVR